MEPRLATGGCQCGGVRYEFSGAPLSVYVCHCTQCRRQSASAFGISVIVPRAAFRVTRGTPSFWSRPTQSGRTQECAFCPTCGSRLWHQHRGSTGVVSVKGGSLDEPVDLRNAAHIWTQHALPGVIIPADAPQSAGNPPPPGRA